MRGKAAAQLGRHQPGVIMELRYIEYAGGNFSSCQDASARLETAVVEPPVAPVPAPAPAPPPAPASSATASPAPADSATTLAAVMATATPEEITAQALQRLAERRAREAAKHAEREAERKRRQDALAAERRMHKTADQ